MQMKYPTLTKEQVNLSTEATLAAKGDKDYPKEPGQCAHFCRQVTTVVLGIMRSWHPGPDAITVGRILAARGHRLPPGTKAEVGDLLVWSRGHGPHGHIAIRVIGNRVAQNSEWNFNRTGDARGFRDLSDLDPDYDTFRLWD